jgi:hypothetical protein
VIWAACEREAVITAQYAAESPEHIRNDSEVRRCRRGRRIEWFLVIPGPRWHHEGAFRPEGFTESIDEAVRSSVDRPNSPE